MMKKSWHVRFIEGKEIREISQSNTPHGVRSTFRVPEAIMAVEVVQNEEVSGEWENEGEKRVGSAICQRRANKGSINIRERKRGRVILKY